MLGLAFEPTPERSQPDIRGVLWIDPQNAQHHLCPATGIPDNQRAVVGVVRDATTSQPLVGTEVKTSWRPTYEPDAAPLGSMMTRTDSTGT